MLIAEIVDEIRRCGGRLNLVEAPTLFEPIVLRHLDAYDQRS